jgi:hypothetical protein
MLPFESEYSAALRFAAKNVVGVSGVRASVRCFRWLPRFCRPARPQSGAADGASHAAAMASPGDDPGPILEQYLLSGRLRICPICWGEQYHSYLYQLVVLPLCPIHHCPLVTQCLNCGADLPYETVDNLRAHWWYLCQRCGKPASGESAGSNGYLQAHDTEVLASALAERLSPVASWLRRVREASYFSPQLLNQIRSKVFPWEPAAFFGSVAQVRLDGPASLLTLAEFPDITVLRWNLDILPNSLAPAWTYNAWADRGARHVLWWHTCRRVEQWAAGKPCAMRGSGQDRCRDSETRAVGLRAVFQSSAGLQALMASRIPPPIPFERHAGGVPRLGLLAYFLGVWATMIWKASLGHPLDPSVTNPAFVVEEAGGMQRGCVFFPSVPGLPIAPFIG